MALVDPSGQPIGTALRSSANGFDAARARRRLANWNPTSASLRTLIATDGALMRARSRDVIRNNPYAAAACESFVANMVGAGITPSSLIADKAQREAVQELWLEWTDEADADGVCDFYGLQALAARALFSDGESFVRFRPRLPNDGYVVPLQIQLIASDMLDMAHTEKAANGNSIVNGVEFDLRGQRVAYHFYRRHPGDKVIGSIQIEKVAVPASEVLHVYRVQEAGQVRGYPLVAAAITKLWFLDQYDDAELDRKKVAAMFAGFIKAPSPAETLADAGSDGMGGTVPPDQAGVMPLEPGMMMGLEPGEDIAFSEPADVGGSYEAFQYRQLLAVFAAMGVPYTIGTGDLKRANYSSLRGALVEYRRKLEQLQHHTIVHQMCRPIWTRWMNDAVLSGAVKIADYLTQPRVARRVKWVPPKFEWVDPLKDRMAELVAVRAGFKSRGDVINAEGYDPEETDERIAADNARADGLNLVLDSDPRKVNKAGLAQDPSKVLADSASADGADAQQDNQADAA